MEIIKTYVETSPACRFIGRRYTDADRVNGSFGAKWGEWWQNDLFMPIEQLGVLPFNDGNVAIMRVHEGMFEYWIGYFCAPDAQVPEGYEYVDIAPRRFFVSWQKGRENELSGLENHNRCLIELAAQGYVRVENDWCMERYSCPRFTTPDEQGNVILDYAVTVEE